MRGPVSVRVEFQLPVALRQEGTWWYSSCVPLDVHSQGRSRHEAFANLEDAVRFFIESCVERGTVFKVLEDAGFHPVARGTKMRATERTTRGTERLSLTVPVPFAHAPA